MSKRFVFFSWEYAFGTGMGLAFVASLIWLSVVMSALMFAYVAALPLLACVYLARRTRVAVELDGDDLSVLAGFGPRTRVRLAPTTGPDSASPYRATTARATDRAQLDIVDHAQVDGPVIEENTKLRRAVGHVVRALKFALSDYRGGGLSGPKVRENMGRLRVTTASGEVRTFIVPAQGASNEAKLAALRAALNPVADDAEAPRPRDA